MVWRRLPILLVLVLHLGKVGSLSWLQNWVSIFHSKHWWWFLSPCFLDHFLYLKFGGIHYQFVSLTNFYQNACLCAGSTQNQGHPNCSIPLWPPSGRCSTGTATNIKMALEPTVKLACEWPEVWFDPSSRPEIHGHAARHFPSSFKQIRSPFFKLNVTLPSTLCMLVLRLIVSAFQEIPLFLSTSDFLNWNISIKWDISRTAVVVLVACYILGTYSFSLFVGILPGTQSTLVGKGSSPPYNVKGCWMKKNCLPFKMSEIQGICLPLLHRTTWFCWWV